MKNYFRPFFYISTVLLAYCTLTGCTAYEGGKVIDGTNLEIGLSIPGTEGAWTINALSYTGGIKVCGDKKTVINVTNTVAETNSYFGIVKTQRYTSMHAIIEPATTAVLTNSPPSGLATEKK